jgi:hypothetical protein
VLIVGLTLAVIGFVLHRAYFNARTAADLAGIILQFVGGLVLATGSVLNAYDIRRGRTLSRRSVAPPA